MRKRKQPRRTVSFNLPVRRITDFSTRLWRRLDSDEPADGKRVVQDPSHPVGRSGASRRNTRVKQTKHTTHRGGHTRINEGEPVAYFEPTGWAVADATALATGAAFSFPLVLPKLVFDVPLAISVAEALSSSAGRH